MKIPPATGLARPLPRRAVLTAAVAAGAVAWLGGVPRTSYAQRADWPTRPVRIVAPFPPGGDLDTIARLVAERLGGRLGQQVIVENRAGAGGTIGAGHVAQSPPDGYTLLLGSSGDQVNAEYLYRQLPFSPSKDLEPLSIVARGHLVLLASRKAPFQDVAGLLAYAKANPGAVTYASAGTGTASHLAGELLRQATGSQLMHVPYKGNAPALTDTIAGHVMMLFTSPISARSHIQQGTLRPLAATTLVAEETGGIAPTFQQAGLPGIDVATLYVLTAPRGVPAAIRDRISQEVMAIVRTDEVATRIRALDTVAVGNTPAEAQALLGRERQRWQKVIREAGVSAD